VAKLTRLTDKIVINCT